MKEFILLIRNEGNYWSEMSPAQQELHMQKASKYILQLLEEGKLKTAQPLTMNGLMLEKKDGIFKDGPFVESKEVIGGFFHIIAADLEEAVAIAKAYPIFDDANVRIEIREIMKAEGMD